MADATIRLAMGTRREYAAFVRRFVPLALAVALAGVLSARAAEQVVTPITPPAEQRVVPIEPAGAQRVEPVSAAEVQRIREGTTPPESAGARMASTAGKILLGVFAAGMSIGLAVVSILFI